ncbi:hypothetical protein N7466_003942 [Penicillium verhagenii]|uniref:uncharacterized protein n=1 Tax=Penicillium verhagenii TaxID=1562060 RepID=UPI002544EC8F|nr:uncharacterized protein N7466_003942 [Penicillium verhagenii]KAJ5934395.1 hypothetical protein N7466_003942 [Penicillium verhagenii]
MHWTQLLLAFGATAFALPSNQNVCQSEKQVINEIENDREAREYCRNIVLHIPTHTATVTETWTPPPKLVTNTVFRTSTHTALTTHIISQTSTEHFTDTVTDHLTLSTTDVVDSTLTLMTTDIVYQTDTATITTLSTATITNLVTETDTNVVTATSTATYEQVYGRDFRGDQYGNWPNQGPQWPNQQQGNVPKPLRRLGSKVVSEICSCLHLQTPTVTHSVTKTAIKPTITSTQTVHRTATVTDTILSTHHATVEVTNTATLDSTTVITVVQTSYFTDTVTEESTVEVTADVTTQVTDTVTVTATDSVIVSSTALAEVTVTESSSRHVVPSSSSAFIASSTAANVVSSSTSVSSTTTAAFVVTTTSNSNYGAATVSSFAGPITLSSAATATMTPIDPPGVNMGGTGVLTPTGVAQVWYNADDSTSDSSSAYPYVRLNMTFTEDSIALDQSIYIKDIVCTSSTLSGSFNNSAAYSYAVSSWPTDSGVILITAASGCSSSGQNIYFLSTSIVFTDSSDSFVATGTIEAIADVLDNVGMDFGDLTYDTDDSSSSSTSSDLGCTSPTSSTIDGLPAISCGTDFDENLDDALGYYSVATEADADATLLDLAPGSSTTTISRVMRRSFWSKLKAAVTKVATVVKSVATTVATKVATVAKTVVSTAVSAVKTVVSTVASTVTTIAKTVVALATLIVTGNYSQTFDISLDIAPSSSLLLTSPWGEGFKFYTLTMDKDDSHFSLDDTVLEKVEEELIGEADPEPGIELWCVDCGVSGEFKLTGAFSISVSKGISKAQLSLTGNMYAGLFIGLDAFAEYDITTEHDLFTVSLPGFEIPDIITLGPSLSLGVSADLDIQAEGQYFIGAGLIWSDMSAVLDLIDHAASTHSGWTPTHNYSASFDGDVTLTSTLGMPVTLEFGLNILSGTYEKEAKLIDTPGLVGTIEYDDDLSYTNGDADVTPANGCYGITWDLALDNTVVLDLSDFDAGTYTLDTYTLADLANGCVGTTVTSTATAASSTSTTSSTSSTTTSTSTTTSATATATPTGLSMDYFIWGDSDQTTLAKSLFMVNGDIRIMLPELLEDFTNSWSGTSKSSDTKSITMLFEYNGDIRVFVSSEYAAEIWYILPGAVSLSPYTSEVVSYTKPSSAEITIVSVVWGIGVIANETVYDALYENAAAGTSFEISNTFFGEDTWVDYVKTGVIFYRDASGNLQHLSGDESSTVSFPTSAMTKRDVNIVASKPPQAETKTKTELKTIPVSVPTVKKRASSKNISSYGRNLLFGRSDNSTTSSNSTSSDDSTGVVTITDTTGALYLNPSINGTLFVSLVSDTTNITSLTGGYQFAADTTEGIIIGDSASRLLYYFPDTMSAVGASRLRLGAWGEIPKTANLISLVPMSTGSEEILVAIDTLGNYYFPFVCGIQNQLNKVFLVADVDNGASVLESDDLLYTVVGGVASNCNVLALVASGL